jgi:ribokinase
VITEGADGGRYEGESSGRWEVVPPPGAIEDSYGCGDSFAAGTTLGLACGEPLEAAVRRGAEWGAIALTRIGAP